MAISVTKKQHWKDSITKRIDRKIEILRSESKALFDEFDNQAEKQALKDLGIKEDYEKLLKLDQEEKAFQESHEAAQQRVYAKLFPGKRGGYYARDEITKQINATKTRQAAMLMLSHDAGRQIARLEEEKENLLDTIWLATSSRQAIRLWQGLSALLGEEATEFQKEILSEKCASPEA